MSFILFRFSGKVIWLKACRTNRDPDITAGYFLEYLRECNGVPRQLRMDKVGFNPINIFGLLYLTVV